MIYKLVALILLGVVGAFPGSAQQETIPQAIARGARGRHTSIGSGVLSNPPNFLADTNLVVRGVVGDPRSFLSDDEMNIYTEYPLLNMMTLYDSDVAVSARPGPVSRRPIAVAQLGGTMTINGREFDQSEAGLPPLRPGTECLFLLQRIGERHYIIGSHHGAFAIVKGNLEPLAVSPLFEGEYRGLTVAQGTARIIDRVRAARSKG